MTPGITSLEYEQRRSRLAAKLPNNAIAIVAASDINFRSGGVFYEFHQDPDFFYLTGFNEPEALDVKVQRIMTIHSISTFVRRTQNLRYGTVQDQELPQPGMCSTPTSPRTLLD